MQLRKDLSNTGAAPSKLKLKNIPGKDEDEMINIWAINMKIQTEISAWKYVCRRGQSCYYQLTFIALEMKANRCLCMPPAPNSGSRWSPYFTSRSRTGNWSINFKASNAIIWTLFGSVSQGTVDWFHCRLHVSQTAWIRGIVGLLAILLAGWWLWGWTAVSNLDCLQSTFCLKIRPVLIPASATTNKDRHYRGSRAWVQLLVE